MYGPLASVTEGGLVVHNITHFTLTLSGLQVLRATFCPLPTFQHQLKLPSVSQRLTYFFPV